MSLATSLTLWSALVLGQTGLSPVPLPQTEPAVTPAMTLAADATPEQLRHIEQAVPHLRGGGLAELANQLEAARHAARQTELRQALAEKQAQLQTLQREVAELQQQVEPSRLVELSLTIVKVDREKLHGADARLSQQVSLRLAMRGNAVIQVDPVTKALTPAQLLEQLGRMQEPGGVTILARPKVTVLDGRSARFMAGSEVPIVSCDENPISIFNGTFTPPTLFRQFGTSVLVQPRLMGSDRVHLNAVLEQTEPNPDGPIMTGGITGSPGVNQRQVRTQFNAALGETVLLPCPAAHPTVTLVFVTAAQPDAFPFPPTAQPQPISTRHLPSAVFARPTVLNTPQQFDVPSRSIQKPCDGDCSISPGAKGISPVTLLLESLLGPAVVPQPPLALPPPYFSLESEVQYLPAPLTERAPDRAPQP